MDKYNKHRFFTALVLDTSTSITLFDPLGRHFYKQIQTISCLNYPANPANPPPPPPTPLPLPATSVQEIGQHFSKIRTWDWWPLNEGSTVFHLTALDLAFTNTAKETSFVFNTNFNMVKIIMNNC